MLDCSVASVIRSVGGIWNSHINLTQTFPFSDSKKDIFYTLLYRKIPYLHISSHQSSKFYCILMHLRIFCPLNGSKKEGSVKSVSNAKHLLFLLSHSEARGIFSSSERVLSWHVEQKNPKPPLVDCDGWLSFFVKSWGKKSENSKRLDKGFLEVSQTLFHSRICVPTGYVYI